MLHKKESRHQTTPDFFVTYSFIWIFQMIHLSWAAAAAPQLGVAALDGAQDVLFFVCIINGASGAAPQINNKESRR